MALNLSLAKAKELGIVAPSKPRSRGMNRTERNYSELLENRQRAGFILWFGWEAIKLRLADRTWYTPDFPVLVDGWHLEFHEVKGFMRDDAAVKIKVAAEQFPFPFILVRKIKGGWELKEVPGKRV